MSLIQCPECGNNVSDKSEKCISCGFPIYMHVNMTIEKKECSFCGALNDGYVNNCTKCGASLNITPNNDETKDEIITSSSNENVKEKDKWISFWLCLFLGYFGAHKFYENKIGMGFLYLFTMGLFGIGWICDIIDILRKPNPYYVFANGSNNYSTNTDVDVERIVLNNQTNRLKAIKEYREQTGVGLKEAMNKIDSAYSDMGVNPHKKYCPMCGSDNYHAFVEEVVLREGKVKGKITPNLNPLKPFTIANYKEKEVRKPITTQVSKFVCNDCGKIFQ